MTSKAFSAAWSSEVANENRGSSAGADCRAAVKSLARNDSSQYFSILKKTYLKIA
jgi:hypothetical protein